MISPKTVLSKFENYLKVHQINDLFNKYNQLDKNRIVYILRHHEEPQCRDDFSNIMSAICSDDNLKKQFVDELSNGMIILRLQKLIDLFNLHNYQTDSLTRYDQTVGLRDNQGYVRDNDNVVLSFPYKDTVLQGSMSTPEDNIKKRFLNKVINQPEINELKEPKVMYHIKYFDRNNLQGTNNYNKFNPEKDSLFIKGNNLEALYSLLPIYRNKVKLIYIDPPFDTGSKEFDYNDNFGQSTWLTFMKNRLDLAKQFLNHYGVIFVNLDNKESAYVKVLMDEIFGNENYINTITFKSSPISGTKTQNMSKTILSETNFIQVYAKNAKAIRNKQSFNPQYIPKNGWETRKNKYLLDKYTDNPKLIPLKDILVKNHIINKSTSIKSSLWGIKRFRTFIEKHADSVCQTTEISDKNLREKAINDNSIHIVPTDDGTQYLYNNSRIIFLKNSEHKVNGKLMPANPLGNLWADKEVSSRTTEHEGGVKFQNAKKPEHLLKRIISMASSSHKNDENKEPDIVMDFFAGSATTQAVAMKMHRRFIGVEQMDYPVSKTDKTQIYIKRLINVINGEKHGISKDNDINWHGGGSFYYAKMMPYNMKYIDELIINRDNSSELDTIAKDIFSNARLIATAQLLHADKYYRKNEVGKSAKEKFKYLFNVLDSNLDYYNYHNINDDNVRKLLSDKNYPLDYRFNKNFYGDK